MEESAPTSAAPAQDYTETDIFEWANKMSGIKDGLSIEVFLISKNYFLYRTTIGQDLHNKLAPLFVDDLVNYVLNGADQGLIVRGFEEAESEENVLQRTRLKNVENAYITLNWLKTQEHEIEAFNEDQHDFKRIKGVLARVKHPSIDKSFFVLKQLPQAMIMKGSEGWMMRNGAFKKFDAEGALRIPPDNQLLVVDQDMFVFNQSKLEQLFGYNAKKYGIALQKMREIEKNFTFTYDGELTMESIVQGKKALVNKLQKIDPNGIKQEDLLKHAEELGIELMTDIDGSIIILSEKDMTTFVNLLNDDYIESPLTGNRYEIKSKKPLKIEQEDR